ncbi:MAG: hypothetical protein ACOC90_02090 [Bacteroidota bacterium]
MKIGTMATYPARMDSLKETLPLIAPQLDILHLYCNDYTRQQARQIKEIADNLIIARSEDLAGDLRDMGKAWPLMRDISEGIYFFMIDDDLLYPTDYCQRHIEAIEDHKSVSAVHGRQFRLYPIKNYFADTSTIHLTSEQSNYVPLDVGGTGTVAWSTDYTVIPKQTIDDIRKFKGMCDIWFARIMRDIDAKIYSIPRKKDWITVRAGNDVHKTLGREFSKRSKKHCQFLNEYKWEPKRRRRRR